MFGSQVKPLSRIIQELRLIKSDSEIALMKVAGQITGKAFIEVYFSDSLISYFIIIYK